MGTKAKNIAEQVRKDLSLGGNESRTSPFAPASVDDSVKRSKEGIDKQAREFEADTDRISDEALGNTEGVRKWGQGIKDTELNKHNKANYAKGQGQYGMFNNRDYSMTLRLAREADAYNNRPQEHMYYISGEGAPVDMGTGYERPKIATMETRAMEQAQQLDTNQKQLAQQLQAAVNAKDLDAFRLAMQQMFGIELDRSHAKTEMRRYERQQIVQDLLSKNLIKFQTEYMRGFNATTAAAVYNTIKTDELFANMLAGVLLGSATPTEQQWTERQLLNNLQMQYAREAGRASPNGYDRQRAQLEAQRVILNLVGAQDYNNRRSDSMLRGNTSAAKQMANWGA